MSMKTVIVVGAALITGIATIAAMLFERRRYLTNNPNATGDNFTVHLDPNCPICLDAMNTTGSSCSLLSCGHFLHTACLRAMDNARDVLQTNRCPVCRTPIRL